MSQEQWNVKIEGEEDKDFDKVLIATGGIIGQPNMPKTEGLEKFRGKSIHVRYFKRPLDFAGKRVMVVGFGDSAADTSTQLAGIADKIYLAHRHGARVLPRNYKGAPIDHTHSLHLFNLQCLILKYLPLAGERFFNNFLKSLQPTPRWSSAQGANGKSLFRLYLNVLSAEKPESLAFLGNVHFGASGFQIFDMASMATAQVWKEAS